MTAMHQAEAPQTTAFWIPMLVRESAGIGLAARLRLAWSGRKLVPTTGSAPCSMAVRSPLRLARERAGQQGSVLVSIFVNPTTGQMAAWRTLIAVRGCFERDLMICAE